MLYLCINILCHQEFVLSQCYISPTFSLHILWSIYNPLFWARIFKYLSLDSLFISVWRSWCRQLPFPRSLCSWLIWRSLVPSPSQNRSPRLSQHHTALHLSITSCVYPESTYTWTIGDIDCTQMFLSRHPFLSIALGAFWDIVRKVETWTNSCAVSWKASSL